MSWPLCNHSTSTVRAPWVVVVGLGLMLAPLGAAQSQARAAEKPEAVQAALERWREGDPQAALRRLDLLLMENPEDLEARYWRGRIAFEQGGFDLAESDWQWVVGRKPTSAETHYQLARLYDQAGRPEEARAHLQQALALQPNWKEARQALASLEARVALPVGPDPLQLNLTLRPARQPLLAQAHLYSMRVYDYTFSTAPTDWEPASGQWEITNRYACDQRWTFYGGQGSGVVATWNKHRFIGDVVVEAYVAFKHGVQRGGWSYQPTHLCLTLCGDGRNPGSGYSFIYAGDHNRRTMIWRRDQLLAATSDPRFLSPSMTDGMPPNDEFHRRWWRLEARRLGRRLSFWIDGEQALEVEDPQPLLGGQVALWTLDNGMVNARTRIFYRQEWNAPTAEHQAATTVEEPRQMPIPQPTELGAETAITTAFPPPVTITLASSSHPALVNDFETSVGQWALREPSNTLVTLTSETAAVGRRSLRIENGAPGGEFAVSALREAFDATRQPRLAFHYRVPPSVRVNLFVNAMGQTLEFGFTGPPSRDRGTIYLGELEQVKADFQWHSTDINLLQQLRRVFPRASSLPVQEIFFANWNEENYLHAGLGGNPMGACWFVDQFMVFGPGKTDAEVEWNAQPVFGQEAPPLECQWALGPQPTAPQGRTTTRQMHCQAADLRPGLWWFSLRCLSTSASQEGSLHAFPLWVDTQPPRVEPPAQPEWGGEAVAVRVQDDSGLDLGSVQLRAGPRSFTLKDPALSYDPLAGHLRFDPGRADLHCQDGQQIDFALQPVADMVGNTSPEPTTWSLVYRQVLDRTPPQLDDLVCDGIPLPEGGFETEAGMWQSRAKGVLVERCPSAAYRGQYGVRILAQQNGQPLTVSIRPDAFDAARYRFVRFDYNAPPQFRGDLALSYNQRFYTIRFTDQDNTLIPIGEVPKVQADGEWHQAQFDLLALLRDAFPYASTYQVQSLMLMDRGWLGNYAGTQLQVDNFELLPVVKGELSLKVTARDAGGVQEIVLDARPPDGSRPPVIHRFTGAETSLHIPWSGWTVLRLVARDPAGNQSPPILRQVWVDGEPPEVLTIAPPAGAGALPRVLRVRLRETGGSGLNPASLQWRVRARLLRLTDPSLHFIPELSEVRWYPLLTDGGQRVRTEPVGRAVLPVALERIEDYAGNPVKEAVQWQFTSDRTHDQTAPWLQVWSPTHPLRTSATFEEEWLEGWRPASDGTRLEWDSTTAAAGRGSLRITTLPAAAPAIAIPTHLTAPPRRAVRQQGIEALWKEGIPILATHTAIKAQIDPQRSLRVRPTTLLTFAYRFPPDAKVDLWLGISTGKDPWRVIHLTDQDTSAPVLGRATNLQTDGSWHWLTLPLGELLQRDRLGQRGSLYMMRLADGGARNTSAGTTFWIDHWMLHDSGPAQAEVSWEGLDEEGVSGYLYELAATPRPDLEKPQRSTDSWATLDLPKGLSFLHLQAIDESGNVSPILHYPFYVH